MSMPRLVTPVLLVVLALGSLVPGDETKLPPELDVVPRDAFLFVSARVGDLWMSDAAKAVRLVLPASQLKPLQTFEQSLGIGLADLDRVSVIVPTNDPSADRPIFLATATRPYDRGKVIRTLTGGAAVVQHQGRGYYPVPGPWSFGALHLLNERSVIVGKLEDVAAVLEKTGKAPGQGAQSEAIALAVKKHHVVVGLNGAFLRQNVPANMPLEAQRLLPLMAMTHASASVDVNKGGVQSTVRMSFMGENQARAGQSAVKDLLALAREGIPHVVDEFLKDARDNPQFKDALKRVDPWLAGVPVKLEGTTVVVSPSLKVEDFGVVTALLVPAIQKLQQAASR